MRFAHVALNCLDLAAIESWYVEKLGFRRERVIPVDDWELVYLSRGDLTLELFQASGEDPSGRPPADGHAYRGLRHIAFQVDDLDRALTEIGPVELSLGPIGFDDVIPGWRTVWISDPEGNIVEISQGYRPDPDLP